ncbi:MAG: GGDEF domain-containing protein [Nitrospirae bacterium]|uniref:sensor domain-containing diguanylate cyclase n=1 Tax=Candidatus Magnetobacterium casense TaxID=1455061 RepID=UPI00058B4700|nr:sensor domain-containing diguanylate cyclase [Candidatus Magnetobacterium casensis]MBF0336403.1 GGDEF domain-containing protein [Nitrospirota bacterium]
MMTEVLFKDVCKAIDLLSKQESATHTIHEILFAMKDSIGISHGVLVLKNVEDDYLRIANRYNISAHFSTLYRRGIGDGAVERVFYKEPVVVVTGQSDTEDYHDLWVEKDYDTAVAVRVAIDGRSVGFLAVYFDRAMEVAHELREFLADMAKVIGEALRKERFTTLLNELRDIDSATGLTYYHFFHQKLRDEFDKSRRHKIPLTLVLMDMNNFKSVLNVYGIDVAKRLYSDLAEHLKSCIRGIDVLGCYGTDEFILYMPNTPMDKAEVVIERFQETLKLERFTEKNLCTTLSIGMATLKEHDTLDDLMTHAQVALYNARVTGKDVVQCKD